MSKLAKGLIVTVGLLCIIIGGSVMAVKSWWGKNKDRIAEAGRAEIVAGRDFGQNTDNAGCVASTFDRYRPSPGMMSVVKASVYMGSCLETSKVTPGFCETVPPPSEIMRTAEWTNRECQKAELTDRYCPSLVRRLQEFCHPKRTAADTA
jgi:hypothetical protein